MKGSQGKVAWLVPSLIEGSGGHRTIVQNVNALIERGYECHVYLEHGAQAQPPAPAVVQAAARQLQEYFGQTPARVHLGFGVDEPYDLIFATAWYTAKFAAAVPQGCPKAYFVQDFEAYFSPMGDGYLLAEHSYRLGLIPVCIGRWLPYKLYHEFGTPARYFDFCADHGVYFRDPPVQREPAVCFICQPEKPRRCARFGLEALGILKHWMPEVKIYLYGSREKPDLWFEHEHLGLLAVQHCNRLYNRCSVGLCISSTNPSRIPFEMMAAGLPVVDLYRPNNVFDMPEGGVLLAETRPESLAQALQFVLRDEAVREQMSKNALAFSAERDLRVGYDQFAEAVDALVEGRFVGETRLEPCYHRPCFTMHSATVEGLSKAGDASPGRQAAAALAADIAARIQAIAELDDIERSRAWRWVQALKRTTPYRWLARWRFGPNWDRGDLQPGPQMRLAQIKNSRAYRLIRFFKATLAYKWYRRRRNPGVAQ